MELLKQENSCLTRRVSQLQQLVQGAPSGPMSFMPDEMLFCVFQYLTVFDTMRGKAENMTI